MILADDLVLCAREADGIEDRLEEWRKQQPPTEATEKIKPKNYNQNDHSELPEMASFKYLDTTIDQDGGCGVEICS